MKIAVYGSSLLSAWRNSAATYYRGLLRDLASRGHTIRFYEPDAFDGRRRRDIDPPDWAKIVVYPPTIEATRAVIAEAASADVVVKASDAGVFDEELLEGLMASAAPHAIRIFWDVDPAAALGAMQRAPDHGLRRMLPSLDLVLTNGGGPAMIETYRGLGAKRCEPIYAALDPATHFRVAHEQRFWSDLAFLGNCLPDREARAEAFFFDAATRLPGWRFLLGGNGWWDRNVPANVRYLGHVCTRDHNAFNSTPLAVLNIARGGMAKLGFAPAARLFEAAGAAACLITDSWPGIELFLKPDEEVLVARDGKDVAAHLRALSPVRARAIGRAALARVLREHSYAQRGAVADRLLHEVRQQRSLP